MGTTRRRDVGLFEEVDHERGVYRAQARAAKLQCGAVGYIVRLPCPARRSIPPCTSRRSLIGSRCGCRPTRCFFSTKALSERPAAAHRVRIGAVPKPLGVLEQGTATFMIAGDRCTRACGFCAGVDGQAVCAGRRRAAAGGGGGAPDAAAARGDYRRGAGRFAGTAGRNILRGPSRAVRAVDPKMVHRGAGAGFPRAGGLPEGRAGRRPEIFNHNLETVERLTPLVRSRAKYQTSLQVLQRAKEISPQTVTKSGVMLGLGETGERAFPDDGRPAGARRTGSHLGAVPAPDAAASGRWWRTFRRTRSTCTGRSRGTGVRVRRQRAAGAKLLPRERLPSRAASGGVNHGGAGVLLATRALGDPGFLAGLTRLGGRLRGLGAGRRPGAVVRQRVAARGTGLPGGWPPTTRADFFQLPVGFPAPGQPAAEQSGHADGARHLPGGRPSGHGARFSRRCCCLGHPSSGWKSMARDQNAG